jgi:NADH-ubiquinone oxidoreductase chain 1
MTEHAAVIFVFFFLAEYASIVLICILNAILFIGGYLLDYVSIYIMFNNLFFDSDYIYTFNSVINISNYPLMEGLIYGLTIGIKSCIMIFIFIWVRASFPRIRFDQLMSFSWTVLLPIVIAFIVIVPCIIYSYEIIPSNISLF